MIRTCPACQQDLGNYDNYFCSSCGTVLPPELIRPNDRKRRIVKEETDAKSKMDVSHKFKQAIQVANLKNKLIALSVFILALGVFFASVRFAGELRKQFGGIFNKTAIPVNNVTATKTVTSVSAPVQNVTSANPCLLKMKTSLSENSSLINSISSYIPGTVDLLVEGHEIQSLPQELVRFNPKTQAQFAQYLEINSQNLGNNYVFFMQNIDNVQKWGVLLDVKKEPYSEKGNFLLLETDIIEDKVVVANDQSVIQDVWDSTKGTILSFNKTAYFATKKQYLSGNNALTILPVTKAGATFISELARDTSSADLPTIFDRIVDYKLDCAVVVGNNILWQ
jgi:hypothetical protein